MKMKIMDFFKTSILSIFVLILVNDPAFAATTKIAPLEGVKKFVDVILEYYKIFAIFAVLWMTGQLGWNSWDRGEINKGEVVRWLITSALLLGFDTIVKVMMQFVKGA